MNRLAIVGVYWNPCGHRHLAANMEAWRQSLPDDPAVETWLVEIVAPGQRGELPDGPRIVRFELEDHIWCIESARNAVIRRHITEVDAVVYVDVDIAFDRADWWKVILEALERYPVIQGFEVGRWLDAKGMVSHTRRSMGWAYQHEALGAWPEECGDLHVGFCWAARRSLWDANGPGIPDWICFGPNDRAMALACTGHRHPTLDGWWGQRLEAYTSALKTWMGAGEFGYAALEVTHRWHGDEGKRRYAERAKRLHRVDWPKHCRFNADGLLAWTDEGRALHEEWFRGLWEFREEGGVPDVVNAGKEGKAPRVRASVPQSRRGDNDGPPQVLAAYWRSDEAVVNLGDYATQVLLELMGYQVVGHHGRAARNFEVCQVLCGTLLNDEWGARLREWRLQIWGAGAEGPLRPAGVWEKAEFFAVRGPRTARLIGDSRLPLGDPALLIPHFIKFTKRSAAFRRVLVPHFYNPITPASCPDGIDGIVSTRCRRENWLGHLEQIASAEFVFSNSLHGCIFAHAYGVPWSPLLRPCDEFNKPEKWKDWLEYLDIDPEVEIPTSVTDAERWWHGHGVKARRPSLKPMLSNLPVAVLDEGARRVIEALIAE